MKHASLVVLAIVLAAPSAHASGGGKIVVVGAGAAPAPGVEATAISYDASKVDERNEVAHGSPAPAPAAPAPAAPAPAPVAISAHNCVPRLDPRGVSLSLEFSEGPADCISFVSPPPAARRDDKQRRKKPTANPEQLAVTAYERVISLAPEPEIGIAPAETGLTGLESFFWVDGDLPPVRATARAGPLGVTAEARPVRYLWDFGDGAGDGTLHPGRPWSRTRPGDIAHLYETKGRYTIDLVVVWAARWRINGGAWRDLGYFSTDSSDVYRVREMIAALVRGR